MTPGQAVTFWIMLAVGGVIGISWIVYGALFGAWVLGRQKNQRSEPVDERRLVPVNINGEVMLVDMNDPNVTELLRSQVESKPRGMDVYNGPGRSLQDYDENKEEFEIKTAGPLDQRWLYEPPR